MAVHMGYVGSVQIGAGKYFCTGSSLNPVQTLNMPDLVQGHPSHHAWAWGKIEIGGNVSGVLTEDSGSLWNTAYNRETSLDHMPSIVVNICYYRSIGRQFTGAQINSLEMSVTAGDVANFTVDFMATAANTNQNPVVADCKKLVTWDACSFTGVSGDVQSISCSLNNNLQRVYVCGPTSADYNPFDVVAGMRTIGGSVTIYAEGAPGINAAKDSYGATTAEGGASCTAVFGPITVAMTNCQLHRSQAALKTDVAIYTVEYKGTCLPDSI